MTESTGQHPASQFVPARRLKRHTRFRKRLLGPKDPLAHRLLRHEEGPGDLRRREATDQTQRQRDASFHGQHRMTSGKDQPQDVIVDDLIQCLVHCLSQLLLSFLKLPGNFLVLLREHLRTAETIDGATLCRGHQPCSGIFRDTLIGPPLQGGNQRVLGQFLGNADVAGDAGDRSDHPRRLDLPHRLDRPVDVGHGRLTPSRWWPERHIRQVRY